VHTTSAACQNFGPIQAFKRLLRNAARAPTQGTLEVHWKELQDVLRRQGKASESVCTYLDGIHKVQQRWAFCYRIGVLTLGINATQRCEGFFGKLKAELVLKGTLCALFDKLADITGRLVANAGLSIGPEQVCRPQNCTLISSSSHAAY
jgi:hypothetical protein